MNRKETILAFTIIGLLVVALAIAVAQMDNCYTRGFEAGYAIVKSPAEQQQQLVDMGYNIKVDGWWGQESELARGLAYGQQSANLWLNENTIR